MKKKLFIILFAIFLTACSGQNNITDNETNITKIENITETQTDGSTETEVIKSERVIKSRRDEINEIYLQNNYQAFIDNIELLDEECIYGETSRELLSHEPWYGYGFDLVDNEGNLCFIKTADYLRNDMVHQIGYYNIFNEEIVIIEEGEDNSISYAIQFANSDYIIFSKSFDYSNRNDYKMFLYDKKTFEITEYHEPTKDPDGRVYAKFTSPPCIFDGNIFFNDIIDIDYEHGYGGDIFINLLKYNISDKTTVLVDTQATTPMLYNDGIAYIKQSDDKESVYINFIDKNGVISTIMDVSDKNYQRVTCRGDEICFSYPLYEEHIGGNSGYEGMVCSGVGYLDSDGNEIKVMEGIKRGQYIDELVFNKNIGVFYFSEKSYPMYYNLHNDTLYILKNAQLNGYYPIICDSFILYLYIDESGGEQQSKYIIKYLDKS